MFFEIIDVRVASVVHVIEADEGTKIQIVEYAGTFTVLPTTIHLNNKNIHIVGGSGSFDSMKDALNAINDEVLVQL